MQRLADERDRTLYIYIIPSVCLASRPFLEPREAIYGSSRGAVGQLAVRISSRG
jgi:hypothetical protein